MIQVNKVLCEGVSLSRLCYKSVGCCVKETHFVTATTS